MTKQKQNSVSTLQLEEIFAKLEMDAKKVREAKRHPITAIKPLVTHNSDPVVYMNSITSIQGQQGSHKSRVAQNIAAAILSKESNTQKTMGFSRNSNEEIAVVYIDTERNHSEQLPAAVQQIQINAGYDDVQEDPPNLEYYSFVNAPRSIRLQLLSKFIEKMRDKHANKPMLIILDVLPDFIGNFNDEEQMYGLMDLLNECINEHSVAFLCVIHENPESDKARGHLGTELINKSSVVLQIKAKRNFQKEATGIYRVKYLKVRATKVPPPYHVKYDEQQENLIVIDNPEEDKSKTDLLDDKLKSEIPAFFIEKRSKEVTLEHLSVKVGIGKTGIEKRLNYLIKSKEPICVEETCNKLVRVKEGRNTFYHIEPVDPLDQVSGPFSSN